MYASAWDAPRLHLERCRDASSGAIRGRKEVLDELATAICLICAYEELGAQATVTMRADVAVVTVRAMYAKGLAR